MNGPNSGIPLPTRLRSIFGISEFRRVRAKNRNLVIYHNCLQLPPTGKTRNVVAGAVREYGNGTRERARLDSALCSWAGVKSAPLQRRPRAWRARWSVVETVLLWGFRKGISRNFRNAEIACKLKGNCATLRFCDTTLSERIKIWRAVRATNAAVYGGSRFEARFRSAVISLRGEIGIPTVAPPSLLLFVLI